MKNLVIAKRYSRALFTLGEQEGKIEQYGTELAGFVTLLKEMPDLAGALQNPLYPVAVKKSIFHAVSEKIELSPVLKSFLNLLIEKKRVQYLPEIGEYYHRLIDEHSNIARAKLRAAIALDEAVIDEIARTLEKKVGKKIVVEFERDPALIGGVYAQIGDLVLDGSVKRQLLNFKESLKRGAVG